MELCDHWMEYRNKARHLTTWETDQKAKQIQKNKVLYQEIIFSSAQVLQMV